MSLWARRCEVKAEEWKAVSTLASLYQAAGDIGEAKSESAEVGNIGFGLCIGEPSEPLLRLGELIP